MHFYFIIFHLFRVLATIEFDDQPLFKTDEIDDIAPIGCCLRNL